MAKFPQIKARNIAGFSLVEIMVGMVIGLMTIIIIMQSFKAFEGQKRTTTTSSDTLENGLIALQAIESDARNAGYGLMTPNGLACTSMNYYENGTTGNVSIAPVAVSEVGASDTLIFTEATSPFAGIPYKLNNDVPNIGTDPEIDNSVSFTWGKDLYLIASPIASPGLGVTPIPCSRLALTNSAADAIAIYNSSSAGFFPTGGYPMSNGFVINIGSGLNGGAGFRRTQYRVDANNDLLVEDVSHMVAQSAVVIASDIVNLQFQYGVAPANTQPGASSPSVDCWTDATGNACNSESGNWSIPSASDIMRIKAIRVAVMARSPLQEKAASGVGAAATCNITPVAPTTWVGGPAVDLSADPNWQCHRYRVYQTIIPLRNVIWANL